MFYEVVTLSFTKVTIFKIETILMNESRRFKIETILMNDSFSLATWKACPSDYIVNQYIFGTPTFSEKLSYFSVVKLVLSKLSV